MTSRHTFFLRPPWLDSASELYRPGVLRLSENLVPIFVDKGCHVVSGMDPYGRILTFLDLKPLLFLSSSYSLVFTRLIGPRSRPTSSQEIW
jgi:hypothetical protein